MPEDDQISVTANPVDEDYIKTTGLQIIAGEDFTQQDIKDAASEVWSERRYHFILNESAAEQLGWTPEQAIGKKMFMGSHRPGFVKGVIKDFHFESMHKVIEPLVLFTETRGHGHLLVKVSSNNIRQTISFVERKWKQLVPYMPFEYKFLDEDFTTLYKSELQLGEVMNLCAAIAMILACAGLFGLSSYVVQRRVKEIGIRKILGASLLNIIGIISENFIKLVLIAIVIGSNVAYFMMKHWLQDFAYRIEIRWWIFAVAGALSIGIALVTVSFQAVKAAIANPVDSLRSE
jgi:putative ABC transport system permease protein